MELTERLQVAQRLATAYGAHTNFDYSRGKFIVTLPSGTNVQTLAVCFCYELKNWACAVPSEMTVNDNEVILHF